MLAYKTTYRWHLTPYWLHKFNPGAPATCWKGCSLIGTYFHSFRAIPKIQSFWTQVTQQVNTISGLSIPLDPELIILNIWRSLRTDPLQRESVELMFCAARHLIAMFWKSPRVLMLQERYLKVWDYFLLDKVSVSILRADNLPVPDNVQEKWLPLLTAPPN